VKRVVRSDEDVANGSMLPKVGASSLQMTVARTYLYTR
jgi:hypothetical protein